MADAKTSVGVTGPGLEIWGRIPRAEAIRQYREFVAADLKRAQERAARAEATPDDEMHVSWWRGFKKISGPQPAALDGDA